MRLTINLDDDLYAMARAHAIATKTSISKAVGNLLRQRTTHLSAPADIESEMRIHPETGLPIIEMDPSVTMEDIQNALQEDDLRYIQSSGVLADPTSQTAKS